MMIPQLWATTGQTESADDIGVYIWEYLPTSDEVEEMLRKKFPWEYEEVGYVHFKTEPVEDYFSSKL